MSRIAMRNFVVGLFVLAGLGSLGYLSFTVGGFSLTHPDRMTIYAHFDEIGGLKPRAHVAIAGVSVGEVSEIVLDDDYRASVRLELDTSLEVPVDTSASIVTNGILGDRYILLQLGAEDLLLKDGDSLDFTESALLLERLVGKLIHNTSLGEDG